MVTKPILLKIKNKDNNYILSMQAVLKNFFFQAYFDQLIDPILWIKEINIYLCNRF